MKKILIIEDDQIVANIYRNKLTVQGYQVEVANSGESGLDLIKRSRPDAVLLDLVLPKLSGVELMRIVRTDGDFSKLPIIVFSNTYLTSLVQEAWQAGATKCLSKATCTPRQVLETLGSVLVTNGATGVQPTAPEPGAKLSAPALAPAPVFDAKFDMDVRRTLATALPDIINCLRTALQALTKSESDTDRVQNLQSLTAHTHTLSSKANLAGFASVAQLAEALEAMLQDLRENPASLSPSTLRTAATAVDCLSLLLDGARVPKQLDVTTAKILVVDDDVISRRAITQALEKAKLKSTAIEDPDGGFQLLSQQAFDLIFLDVDMPGVNGYELCTKLRALPRYKATPVVFVTAFNDFEARAYSMMSGGNDFIAKPFHLMELAVKAIVHILRGQIAAPR